MIILESPYHNPIPRKYSDLRKIGDEINYFPHLLCQPYLVPALPKHLDKIFEFNGIKTNPYKLECDCDYFFKYAPHYEDRDIRRVCIHIYYKLVYHPFRKFHGATSKYLDELTLLLLENQIQHGREHIYKFTFLDRLIILGLSTNPEWINVYLWDERWVKLGFNHKENRWRYNHKPETFVGLESAIKDLLINS